MEKKRDDKQVSVRIIEEPKAEPKFASVSIIKEESEPMPVNVKIIEPPKAEPKFASVRIIKEESEPIRGTVTITKNDDAGDAEK